MAPEICRPIPLMRRRLPIYSANSNDIEVRPEHVDVVRTRILPLIECSDSIGESGSQVFAALSRMVIFECRHPHERIAPHAISMAEVAFYSHICTHKLGGACQCDGDFQLTEFPLAAVLVDQLEHILLFIINQKGLRDSRHRYQADQKYNNQN